MTLFVSCDFNSKGADERTNLAQALPEVMDAQKISESAAIISQQDQVFKDLMASSELKMGSLKAWAVKTQAQLQALIDGHSDRLSSSAKVEIIETVGQLNILITKLNERSEEMLLPADIQSGVRHLIAKNGNKVDYRSIGTFVLELLRLEELKSEGDALLSGQTDLNVGDLQSWDHEIHHINGLLYRQYGEALSPNLTSQLQLLMSRTEDIHEAIKILDQNNQTVISSSEVKTLKRVIDQRYNVKQFIEESEQFGNVEKKFKAIFLAPSFNIQEIVEWSQQSILDINLFLDHWGKVLVPEDVAMASFFQEQLTRVYPYLKFAYEKEIAIDPQLISAIQASLMKQEKVPWEEIFALIQSTYGSEVHLPDNVDSLPIEHGFYLIEDEKILITSNVIRNFNLFSRTAEFEKQLSVTLGFEMKDMLLQAEEIQKLIGIKKVVALQPFLMTLSRTKSKIASLPEASKVPFLSEFHAYQVNLKTMQQMPELQSTPRLQAGLQGERCLSFILLNQKQEATAESCPLL